MSFFGLVMQRQSVHYFSKPSPPIEVISEKPKTTASATTTSTTGTTVKKAKGTMVSYADCLLTRPAC